MKNDRLDIIRAHNPHTRHLPSHLVRIKTYGADTAFPASLPFLNSNPTPKRLLYSFLHKLVYIQSKRL